MLQVSLILPVYNVEKDIDRCLDSILAQDSPPEAYELIVVNDGSTDGTLERVMARKDQFSQITFINQENSGPSVCRNKGIDAAKGKYISFIDSDDYLASDYLTVLSDALKYTDADMAIADAKIDHNGQLSDYIDGPVWDYLERKGALKSPDPVKLKDYPKMLHFQPSIWRRMYRTDFLKGKGIVFPEGLIFEDMPFHFETMIKAETLSLVPRPIYFYNDSRSGSLTQTCGLELFDLFPVFDCIHKMAKADYRGRWMTCFYLFEIRTLRWSLKQIIPEHREKFALKMKESLAFYSGPIKVSGFLARLKKKGIKRV